MNCFSPRTPILSGLSLLVMVVAALCLSTTFAQEKSAGKTKKVTAGDLSLNVPERWKQREPQSQFRVAEFEVPVAKDDKEPGELVITFFGKGGAGSVDDNVKRWVGQFEAEGRKSRVFTGKSSQGPYTLVDLSGTYKKPIGPPIAGRTQVKSGWRVLNAMVQNDKGTYFLKLDGPAATIATAEEEFRTALGASLKDEQEQKSAEK